MTPADILVPVFGIFFLIVAVGVFFVLKSKAKGGATNGTPSADGPDINYHHHNVMMAQAREEMSHHSSPDTGFSGDSGANTGA